MKKITLLLILLLITTIGFSQTIIYSQDFNAGTLPTGWIANNSFGDGDTIWTFGTSEVPGNTTNDFTSNAAIFNDTAAGTDGQHDFVYMWYGSVDVSSFTNVTLSYDYALEVTGNNQELLHVSLWDNTNSVWIPITTYGVTTSPTRDSIDISTALIANPGIDSASLFFGFGYDDIDGSWASGAGIDNVELSHGFAFTNNNEMFMHSATGANTSGNVTVINHTELDGNPNAKIVVSQDWTNGGILNTNTVGVSYNGTNWTIYNEDLSNISINSSYSVFINGSDSNTITHVSDASNQGSIVAYTIIDDALVNGDPNAIIVIGRNYDSFSVSNVEHYGLYYDTTNNKWTIFNEEINAIPTNAAFNVILSSSETNVKAIQHQATVSNTDSYWTEIDSPYLNGNPNAKIVLTHNWGSTGDVSNILITNTQNTWYDTTVQKWKIFNADLTDINVNAKFNLMVTDDSVAAVTNNELVDFDIYPNPVSTVLNINTQEDVSKIIIYNLLGQEVKSTTPINELNVDVSNLNAGVYIVKIIFNNNEMSKRFVKK